MSLFAGSPVFITTLNIPTIHTEIETYKVLPSGRFMDFRELPFLDSNDHLDSVTRPLLESRNLSFVYQRYSTHNYFGLLLSQARSLPFVLEYNGSEVWLNKNWGLRLKYEKLAERIEYANLQGADVVVVVSTPSRDELIERGIESDKILVNPNGVDPEIYSPEVDGSEVRRQNHLEEKTVIGFIGTFGRWHGAEVLVKAYGLLMEQYPEYRKTTHLLMIGDGNTMPQVKSEINSFNIADNVTLTSIVPQEEGPAHLAACNLLASPHVPNLDGTPFFGSPTKLFEYMAMGKGI
ncbi:MAG: glycosyltransferase, partial [Candidatus Adiutricales bacterium]